MPLIGEGKQDVPDAPALKRLGHDLGLARRHHSVLQPMHQQYRTGDPVNGMQRGAGPVGSGRLGIGADQSVEFVGLELGGLLAEGLQIGDAEPAGAGGEQLLRSERAQGREATGAFAADDQPPPIQLPRLEFVEKGLPAPSPSRAGMGMLQPRPAAWLAELVTVLAARHLGR
jgi:hypothetical protein